MKHTVPPRTAQEIEGVIAEILSAPAHQTHGLTAVSAADGRATLEFFAGPAALAPTGSVHGGVIAMLMEPAVLCALITQLPADRMAATVDLHVQHMRPARPGMRLTLNARVLRVGATLAFCEAELVDGDRVCAVARLTKAVVRAG